MKTSRLIEELVATCHLPLTVEDAAAVLGRLREQAARDAVPLAELVLCTDDVNEAARRVLADSRPVCTCCAGTGYRDPGCDVHGDGRAER